MAKSLVKSREIISFLFPISETLLLIMIKDKSNRETVLLYKKHCSAFLEELYCVIL